VEKENEFNVFTQAFIYLSSFIYFSSTVSFFVYF
jgi:hypothetical protein